MNFWINLNLWSKFDFWERFYEYLIKIFTGNELLFYYTSILKGAKFKKKKLFNTYDLFFFMGMIGFYFLKLPFKTLFDILNDLNDKHEIVPSSVVYDFSKLLES